MLSQQENNYPLRRPEDMPVIDHSDTRMAADTSPIRQYILSEQSYPLGSRELTVLLAYIVEILDPLNFTAHGDLMRALADDELEIALELEPGSNERNMTPTQITLREDKRKENISVELMNGSLLQQATRERIKLLVGNQEPRIKEMTVYITLVSSKEIEKIVYDFVGARVVEEQIQEKLSERPVLGSLTEESTAKTVSFENTASLDIAGKRQSFTAKINVRIHSHIPFLGNNLAELIVGCRISVEALPDEDGLLPLPYEIAKCLESVTGIPTEQILKFI